MKYLSIIFTYYFFLISFVSGQNEEVTLNNSLFINHVVFPSYAGAEEAININAASTSYYLGINSITPYDYLLGADFSLGAENDLGIGLCFSEFKTFNSNYYFTSFSFSKRLQTSDNSRFGFGLAVNPFVKSVYNINYENDFFPDQIHPFSGVIYPSSESLAIKTRSVEAKGIFSASIFYEYYNFFWASSFGNLTADIKCRTSNEQSIKVTSKPSLFAIKNIFGYNFIINNISITPNLMHMVNKHKYVYNNGIANYISEANAYHSVSLDLTGTYLKKYFCSLSTNSDFGLVNISLGGIITKGLIMSASGGFFTNSYLHEITGAAYISFSMKYQFLNN